MNNKKMIAVIYDWPKNLTFPSVIDGIKFCLPDCFASLSMRGMYKIGDKKIFYNEIDLREKRICDEVEVHGSLEEKRNIDTWNSYLLYKNSNIGSVLILSASLDILKVGLIFDFMKDLSEISNIGYGYVKKSIDGPSSIFEALGVTLGFPESSSEKKKAEEDARWFEERLLMHGRQKMRHLKGMFRSIYEVNFINDLHLALEINGESLKSLINNGKDFGELIKINNGSYIWTIPENRIASINHCVDLAGGLI